MLAMLHHHQRRVTPSRSNDQNLGGTERDRAAFLRSIRRQEFGGCMEENRIMLAMLHHHQHRVTPSSSNDQNLGGSERQEMATLRRVRSQHNHPLGWAT